MGFFKSGRAAGKTGSTGVGVGAPAEQGTPEIRFLDDEPAATKDKNKDKGKGKGRKGADGQASRGGYGVTVAAFLGVVGYGLYLNETGRLPFGNATHRLTERREVSLEEWGGSGVPPVVVVDNPHGSIEIERGTDDRVVCEITKEWRDESNRIWGGSAAAPAGSDSGSGAGSSPLSLMLASVSASGNEVRVMTNMPPGVKGTMHVKVFVPKDAKARAKGVLGHVRASGLRGELWATTEAGHVRAENVAGRVELSTRLGSIRCSGDDVVLRASTSNGPIEFRGRLGAGRSELETDNGDVRLELTEDQRFHLSAETRNGRARSEFRLANGEGRNRSRRLAGYTEPGDGGVELVIKSGNGDIRIDRD